MEGGQYFHLADILCTLSQNSVILFLAGMRALARYFCSMFWSMWLAGEFWFFRPSSHLQPYDMVRPLECFFFLVFFKTFFLWTKGGWNARGFGWGNTGGGGCGLRLIPAPYAVLIYRKGYNSGACGWAYPIHTMSALTNFVVVPLLLRTN